MKTLTNESIRLRPIAAASRIGKLAVAFIFLTAAPAFAQFFGPGNLVVVVEGNGSITGNYTDNQAAPITLFQYTLNGNSNSTLTATQGASLTLPQTASGANFPVSGEYGSSSEGTLHLATSGEYLTMLGYGISAGTYNSSPLAYTSLTLAENPKAEALAQSSSVPSQSYTAVPRVAALIDANGNVNASTALYNAFDLNNARSAFTADGINLYASGQGNGGADATGGVFLTPIGSINTSPANITLGDAGTGLSQEVRDVQILTNPLSHFNNTLFMSVDSKEGSTNRDFVGTLGTVGTLPTSGGNVPTSLSGFGGSTNRGSITITATNGNSLNQPGKVVNLSPSNYFFASASVLYVADTGSPKNTAGSNSSLGDGGLQKWTNSQSNGSGTWSLLYTLSNGLNLVANSNAAGTTGLYGLTGQVIGGNVYLYATNFTIGDLDQTYLYGIVDPLAATSNSASFTLLATAPSDANFKGVAFAPMTPAHAVEIASSPSGMAFTSSGTGCAPGSYSAPVILNWSPGSSCTLTVLSSQPQSPNQILKTTPTGTQYSFTHWEDGTNTTSHTVTAPTSTAVYTATFTTQYQLTTSAGAGGTVSAGGFIASGTNATVTATPALGYYFVNFTGATTSTSNPLSLTINGPASVTANFAPQTTPVITWAAPSAISFGSALSTLQLDATASVPGTFIYSPPVGTVLSAGSNQRLSVAFTPADTTHYTSASGSTTITVNPASAPASPANLVVTKVLTRSGGNVIAQFTIANTGGTAAANVTITSVKIGSDTAAPLPQNVGTIGAGTSGQATVSVPASVGASGVSSTLTISGTFTGGVFSSTARITLP